MEKVLQFDGSTQDTTRPRVRRDVSNSSSSVLASEYVIVLYPGEEETLLLRVHGPVGHSILLEPVGFPRHVASLRISPVHSVAPFTANINIVAFPTASVGVYPWEISVRDVSEDKTTGEIHVKLIILPKSMSVRRYEELRALYEHYGIQLALWQALKMVYPQGASFTTIKGLYEAIVGSKISKGTVGNILRVLLMKRLVEKIEEGYYKPVETSLEDALARVDVKRALSKEPVGQSEADTSIKKARLNELPEEIQKAYNIAREIREQHGSLQALYFLLYTMLGARKTGFLLLWQGQWFIICEPKTHLCHHYHSIVLSNLLQSLGLSYGIYYPVGGEHEEARKTAEKYLHEHYGGYKEARRLHYMLRDEGYIGQLDNKPYVLRIYHYEDGTVGVDVYDYTGRELEIGYNVDTKPIHSVETWIALPEMHVSKRNEDVYFDFK